MAAAIRVSGILLCLLTGCAIQPGRELPGPLPTAEPLAAALFAPNPLRIGLEHLPPHDQGQEPRSGPRAEAVAGSARHPDLRQPPSPTAAAAAAAVDPLAREALQFLDDLQRADRRQSQREARPPFLDWQPLLDDDGPPLLAADRARAEEHAEWVNEHGPDLLKQPARHLLRRLPLVRELEQELFEFRAKNVPMTQGYRRVHGDRFRLGRLSMRLHLDDLHDPVEVVYMRSGVRIGTSQDTGKLSIGWRLHERLTLDLRARIEYDTGARTWRADLGYRPSDHASIFLSVGDDVDLLPSSSLYSPLATPEEGSTGLLLHAVHTF